MKTRKERNRYKLKLNNKGYRLVVFRSNNHVYAEVLSFDNKHVCFANSSAKTNEVYSKNKTEKANWVGEQIAIKTKDIIGDAKICFDRGGYAYHGVVKAVAESARAKGLRF